MTNTMRFLLLFLIALLLFGAGYGVCVLTQPAGSEIVQVSTNDSSEVKQPVQTNTDDSDNSFQAGWDAAKARLKETNFLMDPEEVTEVAGAVVSVTDDKLEVEINPLYPLSDPDLDVRMVSINADTAIYLLKQKDFAVYEQEMKAYEAKMQALMAQENADLSLLGTPPDFYDKEAKTLSDLKANQSIKVIADTNIKDLKEFVAKEVLIQVGYENLDVVENVNADEVVELEKEMMDEVEIVESDLSGTGVLIEE